MSTRLLSRSHMRRSPATPSILQRSGRRNGVSSLGSIRSAYAVEDLPKSWTISCRSERVENHWMTGTCRASAGHATHASPSRTAQDTQGRFTPTDGSTHQWHMVTYIPGHLKGHHIWCPAPHHTLGKPGKQVTYQCLNTTSSGRGGSNLYRIHHL